MPKSGASQAARSGKKPRVLAEAQFTEVLEKAKAFKPKAKVVPASRRDREREIIKVLLERRASVSEIRAFFAEMKVDVSQGLITAVRKELGLSAPPTSGGGADSEKAGRSASGGPMIELD